MSIRRSGGIRMSQPGVPATLPIRVSRESHRRESLNMSLTLGQTMSAQSMDSMASKIGAHSSQQEAMGKWMTQEMIVKPRQQLKDHIKHVLCKRCFGWALLMASVSTLVAAGPVIGWGAVTFPNELPDDRLYAVFSTLVSFFVVIRTGHALSRLFEASSMVYSILGDWSDAVSSLLSFTRKATADHESVLSFQNILVILVSMFNALCLAELEGSDDNRAFDYNVINFVGFPTDVLAEISVSERKVETVFQLIQALVVDNMDTGILNVPAPILTRSFQEMSQAMLKVHEAHKLVNVPYPVELNAASSFLLLIFTIISIWYLPHWMQDMNLALAAIFILVFIYWFVHFICGELEQPFSPVCTAIDLALVQDELNQRLQTFVQGARRSPLPLRAERVSEDGEINIMERSIRTMQTYVATTAPQALQRRATLGSLDAGDDTASRGRNSGKSDSDGGGHEEKWVAKDQRDDEQAKSRLRALRRQNSRRGSDDSAAPSLNQSGRRISATGRVSFDLEPIPSDPNSGDSKSKPRAPKTPKAPRGPLLPLDLSSDEVSNAPGLSSEELSTSDVALSMLPEGQVGVDDVLRTIIRVASGEQPTETTF